MGGTLLRGGMVLASLLWVSCAFRPTHQRVTTRIGGSVSNKIFARYTSRRSDPQVITRQAVINNEGDTEVSIKVAFRGATFYAREGQLLRTAMLENGVTPHNGRSKLINCRGLETCGTCAVHVVPSSAVEPKAWTSQERLRLNFPPHKAPNNARLRLACQCRIVGGQSAVVEVVKYNGFWGQGAIPSTEPAEAGNTATQMAFDGRCRALLPQVITPDEQVNEDALSQLVALTRDFSYLKNAQFAGHEDFKNAEGIIKKAKRLLAKNEKLGMLRQRIQSSGLLRPRLSILSAQELLEIVCGVVDAHPELTGEVERRIRPTDMSIQRAELKSLEDDIKKALPGNHCPGSRGAFGFKRTSPSLQAFKRACTERLNAYVKVKAWYEVLKYVAMVMEFVARWPTFEQAGHNQPKTSLIKKLMTEADKAAKVSKTALRSEQVDELVAAYRGLAKEGDEEGAGAAGIAACVAGDPPQAPMQPEGGAAAGQMFDLAEEPPSPPQAKRQRTNLGLPEVHDQSKEERLSLTGTAPPVSSLAESGPRPIGGHEDGWLPAGGTRGARGGSGVGSAARPVRPPASREVIELLDD